ncbi:MAG TPA: Ger(x)C family spore germination protein [Symbiobacteriaceae bacterium]|nr:Ger(x)C family spore germination protein [Symbiobacteriaceae bacterium]
MRILALILSVSLVVTGCWSRRELTEVSFAGILGVDWEEGKYMISLVISSPRRQSGEGGGSPSRRVWTVSQDGPSLDAALARMDQTLDRSLTLSHIRAIVFGEGMARRGIGPVMDFLLRSVEVRPTAWVSVTNGDAKTLLGARPRQDELSEGPLGYQDAAQRRSSLTMARRLTEVANILQEEGVDLTLPMFRRGDQPGPQGQESQEEAPLRGYEHEEFEVKFGGSGIFKGDKLVGWLNPDETRGHLWVKDRIMQGAIIAQCPTPKPDQRIVFRLRHGEGELKTRVENGQVKGSIEVKVVADVNEISCEEPVLTDGNTEKLEQALDARMRKTIGQAVAAMKRERSDFLGFGQALYRKQPAAFTSREKQWDEILTQLPVTVDVSVRIPRLGQLNRRYRWKTGH